MKHMRFAGAVAGIIVLAGCTRPATDEEQAPTSQAAADSAAAGVVQVRDGWATAWKAGDAAQLASYYAADAVDMENHQSTVTGAPTYQNAMASQFASATPRDISLVGEKTVVEGDMAYDRGTYSITMQPKAGGQPVTDSGRYLVILRKQADGSWKIIEAMTNSATPLTTTGQ